MIKHIQGMKFSKAVKHNDAILIFTDGLNKFRIENPVKIDEVLYIIADSDTTKNWIPGKYKYQLIEDNSISEEGDLFIKANLIYSDSPYTYWQKVLMEIDERLAGKSRDPASSVSVDGKSIQYWNFDELLKLRAFVVKKIAEDEENPVYDKNNQGIIKFDWRG